MSLTSALFAGVSGLNALGSALRVIGDNVANINTIGFKGSRATFQDVLAQSISTAAGASQLGRGCNLSSVNTTFVQGSFESTNSPTDLAIEGQGFFMVRQPNTESIYYTRAGQFQLNKDGYFTNPAGYIVEGWKLNEEGQDVGAITDIKLDSFSLPPKPTDLIQVITQLDANAESKTDNLFGEWNGSQSTPIASEKFAYHTSLKVYDSLGVSHDITIYFDPGAEDNTWEFIVTCSPDEDQRAFSGTTDPGLGMLAAGTLHFTGAGALASLDFQPYIPGTGLATGSIQFSNAGYPMFTVDFIAGSGGLQTIDFNVGIRNVGSGGSIDWQLETPYTTQYATASTTVFQTQTGYASGFLDRLSVSTDGIITGHYSNGQITPLYRVALARFNNPQGLSKEGGNLFAETRSSGDRIPGHPGENGLGRIAPNSLEQSNVDLATEFVRMIINQRGFQANSKIITTVDAMLDELIRLKR
ncbi:flagellar hook protein FlgE [Thermococcus sp.]|uniref:flagellar hook protein FlgE n=1 Tax=Thermococcus sp. TaxID=35749 RepID=UPI002621171A|nr:flagellar hook protein FlgE [Thermococcus sp.]MCD6144069.1 flagellar hook protein FlgE [Thermococcus sp.]